MNQKKGVIRGICISPTKLDIGEKAKDKTSSDKIEKETGGYLLWKQKKGADH